MKVGELIDVLKGYPRDMEVVVEMADVIADVVAVENVRPFDQRYSKLNKTTGFYNTNGRGNALIIC